MIGARAGIDARRALDIASRVAELGHEHEFLRLLHACERDVVLRNLIGELQIVLKIEMEALRADPCGVLGRAKAQGEGARGR